MEAYGDDVKYINVSSVYETEPQGLKGQPWFFNQVAKYQVDPEIWAPEGFLSSLSAIENQMLRARGVTDGPRVIDLDLLLFGDKIQTTGYLDLPHPRMLERAFVLVPLAELEPNLVFPDGTTIKEALSAIEFRQEGTKIWQG